MKHKFSIHIGKPRYGWAGISIYNNKQLMIHISASDVFNPFPYFLDVLSFLKKEKQNPSKILFCSGKYRNYKVPSFYDTSFNDLRSGVIRFSVDQEGYDALLTFKVKNDVVSLTTETLRDSVKDKKRTFSFDKKEIIQCIEKELKNFKKYELGEFSF